MKTIALQRKPYRVYVGVSPGKRRVVEDALNSLEGKLLPPDEGGWDFLLEVGVPDICSAASLLQERVMPINGITRVMLIPPR